MRAIGNGRYDLTERIAAGGMGEVWRGVDNALGRSVAVKLLHSNLVDDPKFRSRFELEARNAAALHDPAIATVFDYGDDIDPVTGRHTAYLVMEYVDGVAMSDLLTGPLPPERAASLIAQVADGLAVAHAAGIVHRDVKPANFLVTAGDKVKITDFGIARALGATALTDSGIIMGTPHYVAPEVAEGREATPASDIYSLGVVLYECLSGRKPFAGDTPVAVVLAHLRDQPPPLPTAVPQQLAALVAAAMAKDPAQRPPSAEQFAAALRSAAADAPGVDVAGVSPVTAVLPGPAVTTRILAPPPSGGAESSVQRRWWPLAAVAAAALLIAGTAWGLGSVNDSDGTASPDRGAVSDSAAAPGASADATTQPTQQTTVPPTQQTDASPTPQTVAPPTPQTTAPPAQETPPATTTSPLSQAPAGADYVGMWEDKAEDALKEREFDVKTEEVPGGTAGVVAQVSPLGLLAPGTEVTLFVYTGETGEGDDKEKENSGKGDEQGEGDDPGKGDDKGKSDDPGKSDENGKDRGKG